MTNEAPDSWGGAGEWEPERPGEGGAGGEATRGTGAGRGGIILMVSTALAVVLAVTLGIGAGLGWFSAPPAGPEAGAAAPGPVDSGDEAAPASTPLAVPTPTPGALGDEKESQAAADTAIDALLTVSTEIAQRGDGNIDGIDAIATGFVEGELQSLAIERSQLGYTQTGTAKITSVTTRTVDLTASPPSIVLEVCIDSSDIDVVDANGASMHDRLYDSGAPTLHLYGAQFIDGLWKIATHEIPDNAPCT